MSDTDNNLTKTEDAPLRLVKSTERSKQSDRMDHTSKLSFWCIGIIAIVLLFYFLSNMITDAEELDVNTPAVGNDRSSE